MLLALVAVSGGFFGAGIGIVTLAVLGWAAPADIHAPKAVKSVSVASIDGAGCCFLLLRGAVELVPVLVMAGGAILGGYAGAAVARRIEPERARRAVVAIGILMSMLLAFRYYA